MATRIRPCWRGSAKASKALLGPSMRIASIVRLPASRSCPHHALARITHLPAPCRLARVKACRGRALALACLIALAGIALGGIHDAAHAEGDASVQSWRVIQTAPERPQHSRARPIGPDAAMMRHASVSRMRRRLGWSCPRSRWRCRIRRKPRDRKSCCSAIPWPMRWPLACWLMSESRPSWRFSRARAAHRAWSAMITMTGRKPCGNGLPARRMLPALSFWWGSMTGRPSGRARPASSR